MRAILLMGVAALALSACDGEGNSGPQQRGPNPELPEPNRGLLPDMTIPRPTSWGDDRPAVPQGYTIQAIATDLRIPRQTLILPNGDILVTEGTGGQGAPRLNPKAFIANIIKGWGKTSVPAATG
ncbi:hypothetical protein [Teichococcus aestuarii]|uniref:hypothetical protein n=1 Tax=Teichococcus aestuarii TaxID=568898 RepID=UPI00361EAF12